MKQKKGLGKLRQSKPGQPWAWGLACSEQSLGLLPCGNTMGLQVVEMHLKQQYAAERSLLFILFSVVTVMSEHAVSYWIYIWP